MTRKRKKTIKKSMGEKGKKSIVDFIVSNKEFIVIYANPLRQNVHSHSLFYFSTIK